VELGDQLRKLMKDSGLALYAIAKGSGVSYQVVYRFYHGKRDLRLATAGKVAKFLGLQLGVKPRKKG